MPVWTFEQQQFGTAGIEEVNCNTSPTVICRFLIHNVLVSEWLLFILMNIQELSNSSA